MTEIEISHDDLSKINLTAGLWLTETVIGKKVSHNILINAEYFRPKFEEILKKKREPYSDKKENILKELIECLKNPEGI